MDRVLIVSEEVIFASHVEKTLKEVGFEVAIQSNESGLGQAIQNFNPDVLVVKGGSVRVSSLRVGQRLKEVIKFKGKVILILNKSENINPNDINRVKMDYLLFEPVGAVKVVSHVLALMPGQREAIRSRLNRLTESDPHFRKQEELFTVSGKTAELETVHVKSSAIANPEEMQRIKSNIEKELTDKGPIQLKKIDSYNKAISNLDVDLKKGLNKRQTGLKQKALRKELLVDPGKEKLDSLDEERRKFAAALMKKK